MPETDLELADKYADEIDSSTADNMRDDLKYCTANNKPLRFGKTAGNIAEDRYGAGSTAALVTLVIALRHGHEAAWHFVEDLQHHER